MSLRHATSTHRTFEVAPFRKPVAALCIEPDTSGQRKIFPSTFGTFSNDLLVGNFGNGQINAFDPVTGAFLGTLSSANGSPITDSGPATQRSGAMPKPPQPIAISAMPLR